LFGRPENKTVKNLGASQCNKWELLGIVWAYVLMYYHHHHHHLLLLLLLSIETSYAV
jgi:hypothetical protein